MKKILFFSIIAALVILAGDFSALVFSDVKDKMDKPSPKKSATRETRMKASGVVKDLTRNLLVIERNITGEVMEFQLEKELSGISVGDKVAVSYVQSDGRNIAKRVIKNQSKQK